MKKIYLVLISLLCTVFAAQAAKVTDLSQLSNDKVYTIRSERAFLLYQSNKLVSSNGQTVSATRDPQDANQQFRIEKNNGKYYFSYSTGDSHYLCYAIGDSPYGPFTFKGVILDPVVGWTTHHSIVKFKDEWFLFYHDCVPSNDTTWLRSLKVQKLYYNDDGTIKKVNN